MEQFRTIARATIKSERYQPTPLSFDPRIRLLAHSLMGRQTLLIAHPLCLNSLELSRTSCLTDGQDPRRSPEISPLLKLAGERCYRVAKSFVDHYLINSFM